MDAPDCVIVINCGSSSLKFAVFSMPAEQCLMKGIAERLSTDDATLKIDHLTEKSTLVIPGADHHQAMVAVAAALEGLRPLSIGHRVVHGGEAFSQALRIDEVSIAAIESCSHLAPLHNPANLIGIRAARLLFPAVPHIAVFDTAFHQSLTSEAFLYAIPYWLYEEKKIRRYGFHGTSFRYVASESARLLDKSLLDTNVIIMHLGNGCSACAIRNGKSVDTTMGLTPSEGLVMGTRSGDVDPALHQFLQDHSGMRLAEITHLLNTQSGLLGISGLSNDMRTLEQAAAQGHARAQLAIQIFCYRLAKSICGLMASLDRLDAFIFTGGIGENSSQIRQLTMHHLQIHGVILDAERNLLHGRDHHGAIHDDQSRFACLVVPTNEELMIARDAYQAIHFSNS
ncbi:MAG: acetate kinase [Verrucomicrobia bacterium]|nr:MAG: acetate kinase [Verrucomicrobiota bacterium]